MRGKVTVSASRPANVPGPAPSTLYRCSNSRLSVSGCGGHGDGDVHSVTDSTSSQDANGAGPGGGATDDQTPCHSGASMFFIFISDLGADVTDDILFAAFAMFPSIISARVMNDAPTNRYCKHDQ